MLSFQTQSTPNFWNEFAAHLGHTVDDIDEEISDNSRTYFKDGSYVRTYNVEEVTIGDRVDIVVEYEYFSEEEEEEEEEEVRCVCPTCFGEGWTFVSAKRAKELKREELMEECCPYGDKCKEEEDSEEEEED